MADFQTFDLGTTLQQAANIRGTRTVNQLNQQRLDANALLQDRASMFNPLAQEFFARPDDPNIQNQLFQIDPARAQELIDFSQNQQDQEIADQQQKAGRALRIALALKNSANAAVSLKLLHPEQHQEALDNGITEEQLNDDAFVKGDLFDMVVAHFFPLADPSEFKAEDFFDGGRKPLSAAGKQSEDRRNLVSQFGPDSPEVARFDASTVKAPLVSITGDPERDIAADEAAKFRGRAAGERVAKFTSESDESRAQNLQLSRAAQFVSDVKLQGPGTKIFNQLKAFGVAFGVDVEALGITDDTASAQALESVSNEIALRLRNPDSGLGLTGNTSDRDITFLKSIPPSLGKTKGGNELIIDYARRLNNHKIKRASVVQKFVRKNGVFGTDAQGRTLDEILAIFADENQIFSNKDFETLAKASSDPVVSRRRFNPETGKIE